MAARAPRARRLARFRELGLPDARRTKRGRYTNIAPIARTPYLARAGRDRSPPPIPSSSPSRRARLVFVNGLFARSFRQSRRSRACASRACVGSRGPACRPRVAPGTPCRLRGLRRSPPGTPRSSRTARSSKSLPARSIAAPIELLFLSARRATPSCFAPRILVVAGRASQATVVETLRGRRRRRRSDQRRHRDRPSAEAPSSSTQGPAREPLTRYHVHTVAGPAGAGRRISRRTSSRSAPPWPAPTSTFVSTAKGGECDSERPLRRRGLAASRQPHDDRPRQAALHEPRALQGDPRRTARGVFHGTILVRQDAQKTDAMQTNKNLLLSREALVDSTPALEILADDVKCTHGSTIGQLDADALFYLRSRGIGEEAGPRAADLRLRRRRRGPAPASPRVRATSKARSDGPGVSALVAARRCVRSPHEHGRCGDRIAPGSAFDVERIRRDFPILSREGPRQAARLSRQRRDGAEAPRRHRCGDATSTRGTTPTSTAGVHWLSVDATEAYEAAREKVRDFRQRSLAREIVFVRGTTEADQPRRADLRAHPRRRRRRGPDHRRSSTTRTSCRGRCSARRRAPGCDVAPIDDSRRDVDLDELERLLTRDARGSSRSPTSRTRSAPSIPVRRDRRSSRTRAASRSSSTARRRRRSCRSTCRQLGCDFYAFSGHKIYGPTGIGVLYGKAELLEAMPPYQGGGDMISSVTFEKTTYNVLPYKFEAGTPNIAGAIGLRRRPRLRVGDRPRRHRRSRGRAARLRHRDGLTAIPGLRVIGTATEKAGVLSFMLEGVHPHDIGTVLDREGIAIRTGHHCAQPVMDCFGVPATARASFGALQHASRGRRPRRGRPQSHRGCSARPCPPICATCTRK